MLSRCHVIADFVGAVTRAELAAHPHDAVAAHLVEWARDLSIGTQHFVAFYLLSHGAIKLWVIIGLLRERLWYYPVALVVFTYFHNLSDTPVHADAFRFACASSQLSISLFSGSLGTSTGFCAVSGAGRHDGRGRDGAARRQGGAGHRRLARDRSGGGPSGSQPRGRMSCLLRARSAGWRNATTQFALLAGRPAAVRRWFRSTCATSSKSTNSRRRCISAIEESRHPGRQCRAVRHLYADATTSTPQEWGEVIDLNLTANWRLIRAMDPLLRMAPPAGRAIFVTGRPARDAPPYYGILRCRQGRSGNHGAHLCRARSRAPRCAST